MIHKNHFALEKQGWKPKPIFPIMGELRLVETNPSYETFKSMLDKVSQKWFWNKQDRYNEFILRERLAHP